MYVVFSHLIKKYFDEKSKMNNDYSLKNYLLKTIFSKLIFFANGLNLEIQPPIKGQLLPFHSIVENGGNNSSNEK